MKWFDRWLAKKCKQVLDDSNTAIGVVKSASSKRNASLVSEIHQLSSPSVNFNMFQATGGTVIEMRYYDRTNETVSNSLYIIPSEKDLGQELAHIITVEALKR